MTVSLDTSLASGGGEGRQRLLRSFTRAGGFIGKMARNPLTAIGGGIIFLLVIVAIFAPWIAPYKPLVQDLNNALTAPNAQHWFGTDEFGRDIFSRILYGGRIAVQDVVLAALFIVQHQADGEFGATGPLRIGRVRAMATQVSGITVHIGLHFQHLPQG